MDRDALKKREQELAERRTALVERLDGIRAHYREGLSPNMDEQSIELESEEVHEALEQQARQELQEVEDGLRRIREALGN